MTAIEQKEIKGLNLKHILAVIGCTVTFTTTVMVGFNNLNKRIDDQSHLIEKMVLLNETEIRTLKVRLDVIERDIQELKLKQQ